jgi:hypothetical protein
MWLFRFHLWAAPYTWLGWTSLVLGLLGFGVVGWAYYDYLFGDKQPKENSEQFLVWMLPLSLLWQIWVVQLIVFAIFVVAGGLQKVLPALREQTQEWKRYPERKHARELAEQKLLEQEANETLKLIGVTTFSDNRLTEALDELEAQTKTP